MQVLSIDFDFWIPESPCLDLGHRETSLFINGLWDVRAISHGTSPPLWEELTVSKDELPTPSEAAWYIREHSFAPAWRKRKGLPIQLVVAESHASLPHWLESHGATDVHLIHIDAHHDCGYGTPPPKEGALGTDNWLPGLIERGIVNRVEFIRPSWRFKDKYNHDWQPKVDALLNRFTKEVGLIWNKWTGLSQVPYGIKPDVVFVCRSGAWTPPWCDNDFIGLLLDWFAVIGTMKACLYTYKSISDFRRPFAFDDIRRQAAAQERTMQALREKVSKPSAIE